MNFKKRILVTPLNWGLGHATRCIPIINALLDHEFEPIIASDGNALKLLQKEFPSLICLELPSYHIQYSKHGFLLKWELLKSVLKLLKAISEEKKQVQHIIKTYDIKGIISDNRFGVYDATGQIPSVYITHQLRVFSGFTTWITTQLHQHIIKKHNACWVPDFENTPNLSGQLGHPKTHNISPKYIGALSRFSYKNTKSIYDILVILSGPEPQRSLLEAKLLLELQDYQGSVVFVQGVIESVQKITKQNHITLYNFMQGSELEKTIQQSDIIISRSGYTSIMDLATLRKKAFFIPTPGQNEQLYLAKRLDKLGIAPYCTQVDFNITQLNKLERYSEFTNMNFGQATDFKTLFSLF
jgi:uncharacterized protein (TIGR00661 family)